MTASPLNDEGVSGAEIRLQTFFELSIAGASGSEERNPVSQTAIVFWVPGFDSASAPTAAPTCHPSGGTVASRKMIRLTISVFGKRWVFTKSFLSQETSGPL
jgi:hypothetical protein